MKFLAQLQNPPREFTAIPFWFLNGDLTDAELRRQLADFAAHGIYGVVLHPRMGLSPEITYLGERYFALIRTAVEAAAALDMKIVLYDEGMYPSGSASGLVVKDHPELASEGITLTQTVLPGDELLAQTENGALVVRKSGGTMRGLHWGEDDGEKNAPLTADILNPEAVHRFVQLTHEAYYREVKEYFGSTIIGFFTDEPSILGRNVSGMFPWTHGFAEIFRRAGGNAANLAALFDGRENDDTRLYHKLLLQREGEVYYGTLSRWCEAHGIGLMGHPHQSDDIEVEKYFAVPGQDLVLRWLAPEKDGLAGIDSTMGKCSADAARLMHRRRNANECFGACNKDDNPWQLSGGDIKWYTDWLAVRGVNLFIPHAFYYSIRCDRKDWRDEATHQVLLHIKYLYCKNNGLFYHGFSFIRNDNFGGIFWCRGNSWFTLGLTLFLEKADYLDGGTRQFIIDTFRTHAEALRSYQAEDGLFHTVIDDATSYEEASGTAAMAAGLLRGMKAGILDESYRVCADRAITALCDCVDTDGTVLKVSAGTAMGMNAEHYKGIGIRPMAYGQALTLIALCEALQ